MKWSDIQFAPPPKILRQFAVAWLVFFFIWASVFGFARGNWTAAIILASTGALVGIAGLIVPKAVRWVFVGAMIVAFPIGWVVSQCVLGLLFFLVFTPVALVFRCIGRDALNLRRSPNKATYWMKKETRSDPRSYFRQY
jgi:hypothetical protein